MTPTVEKEVCVKRHPEVAAVGCAVLIDWLEPRIALVPDLLRCLMSISIGARQTIE